MGNFPKALELFKLMSERNTVLNPVIYGAILDACAKSQKMEIAIQIFKYM